jgi:hypothetical protein
MGKNSRSGPGIQIRDEHPRSYFFALIILKFFDADADLRSEIFLILDPGSGMKGSDPG